MEVYNRYLFVIAYKAYYFVWRSMIIFVSNMYWKCVFWATVFCWAIRKFKSVYNTIVKWKFLKISCTPHKFWLLFIKALITIKWYSLTFVVNFSKNLDGGAGEITQDFRVHTTFVNNQSSVANKHIRVFLIIVTPGNHTPFSGSCQLLLFVHIPSLPQDTHT